MSGGLPEQLLLINQQILQELKNIRRLLAIPPIPINTSDEDKFYIERMRHQE
jgi:hypothetical protein